MSSQSKPKTNTDARQSSQNLVMIGVIVAIAVIAAVIFIVLLQNQANQGGATGDIYPFLEVNNDGTFASDFESGEIYQWRMPDGGFVMGNPNAQVTLVEFADFLCPHCQSYKPQIDRFVEEFVLTGQAKFEYRMIPTQTLSEFVGGVAECAAEAYEGGFYPVHEELFRIARSGAVTDSIGRNIAEEFDLDYAELLECTSDADQLRADGALGSRAGVASTPTIRIRIGDSDPQPIGPAYERGQVPYEVIAGAILTAQVQ